MVITTLPCVTGDRRTALAGAGLPGAGGSEGITPQVVEQGGLANAGFPQNQDVGGGKGCCFLRYWCWPWYCLPVNRLFCPVALLVCALLVGCFLTRADPYWPVSGFPVRWCRNSYSSHSLCFATGLSRYGHRSR